MIGVEADVHHSADNTLAGICPVEACSFVNCIHTGYAAGLLKHRTVHCAEVYGGYAWFIGKSDKLHRSKRHKSAAGTERAGVKAETCKGAFVIPVAQGDEYGDSIAGSEFGGICLYSARTGCRSAVLYCRFDKHCGSAVKVSLRESCTGSQQKRDYCIYSSFHVI